MNVDINFLEYVDLDWFSPDGRGAIAHFASGGCGFVPDKALELFHALDECWEFLFSLPNVTEAIVIEKNLSEFESDNMRDRYLESFVNMASKGFYSFDVTELVNQSDQYKLVAAPQKELTLDDIPTIVKEVLVKNSIKNCHLSQQKLVLDKSNW